MLEAHEALDQDGPGKSAEIQGRHSVPRGRVAFVEIALPPNLNKSQIKYATVLQYVALRLKRT